jgi:hypothetical protein
MNSMYFFFLAIVGLALIFNIYLITNSKQSKSELGVAPVIQLIIAVPIFIVSSLIFYFMQNNNLGINARGLFLIIPFILEISYFAFTKDLFSIFNKDSGGFLIRSYLYSIGLATIMVGILNWILI